MRTPTVRLAFTALATFAVLAGCSGDDKSLDADLDETSEETSTTVAPAPEKTGAEAVRAAADAPAHFETTTMEMVTEMDGEPVMSIRGTVSTDNQRGDAVVTSAGSSFRMLQVDGTYYYAFPGLPPGIEWVSMSVEEAGELTGIDVSAAGSIDPTSSLAILTSIADDVAELGTERMFGVEATGYRATVTSEDLVAMNVESGLFSPDLAETMPAMYPETFAMDVWIDADGLPRRQSWTIPMTLTPGQPPSEMSYRLEYAHWGAPLDVQAPPAASVISMADMADMAGAPAPSQID